MPLEPFIIGNLLKGKVNNMKCEYCGKEFTGRKKKYCSNECCYNADKDRKRMQYTGKREKVCIQCGIKLPKFRTRFCSDECCYKYENIKSGAINHPDILIKTCPVCGREFKTWKSRQKTCSPECSKKRKLICFKTEEEKEAQRQQDRERYAKNHPDMLTEDEKERIKAEREKHKAIEAAERKARQKEREAERERLRNEKAKIKQANIAQWLEYEAEHKCVVCNKTYIAHHPNAKYCSKTCQRKVTKIKRRYAGITIDRDISLFKLAERDHNQCQICGLFVDWTDRKEINGTVICGGMYPSIDHIKPISRGGLHSWDNVQLAHRRCNTCKSNTWAG